MAQVVEHILGKDEVSSSNLLSSSIKKRPFSIENLPFLFFCKLLLKMPRRQNRQAQTGNGKVEIGWMRRQKQKWMKNWKHSVVKYMNVVRKYEKSG